MRGRQIVYAGDSTVREVFWATAKKLDQEQAYQEQHLAHKHSDISFQKDGINVEFIWDPYLNTSALHNRFKSASRPPLRPFNNTEAMVAIALAGGGLWHARYLDENYIKEFAQAIDRLAPFTSQAYRYRPVADDALRLIAPVQMPWYESLSKERQQTMTPTRVNAINERLLELSVQHSIPVAWAFSLMSLQQPATYDVSGLHVVEDVAEHMVDILLNVKCNTFLMEHQGYPMEKTCCLAYPKIGWTQRLVLVWLVGLDVLVLFNAMRFRVLSSRLRAFHPPRKITRAMAVLALTLHYCYLADRTQLWNKAQKQFISREFAVLCATAVVVGVVSICRSKGPPSPRKQSVVTAVEQPFLSRDQTDEWKGWMQIIILVYHYTGGSQILPIYEVIRLLVASYIFMTGFGHSIFFARKADYSLKRSASVLLRLNLLSILLPFVMGTEYLFYYFAPLTSLWYVVTYLTMYVGHHRNHSLRFLIGKTFVSAALVNAMISNHRIFEDVFTFFRRCCAIQWDLREWRFRLQLDSYIVFAGMLSGILFLRITEASSNSQQGDFDCCSKLLRSHLRSMRLVAILGALVTPPIFCLFARNVTDKYTYNAYVPYLSAFPILSFVILRNFTPSLRNHHSAAFAWVGRISLETFTLQFHIWLAADTKGLLSTGLFNRWGGRHAELVALSIIFLWISKQVSVATQTITSWIVDPSVVNDEGLGQNDKSDELLPRIKSQEDLTYAKMIADNVSLGAVRSASGVKNWIARDLRIRLLTLALILWVLNRVSLCLVTVIVLTIDLPLGRHIEFW